MRRVCVTLLLLVMNAGCEKHSESINPESMIGTSTGIECPALLTNSDTNSAELIIRDGDDNCRVVASLTLQLAGSIDGTWPDPAIGMVSQDSRGRLYSGAGWNVGNGQLIVWEADGSFLTTIGRLGEGPGEFPLGNLSPFVGPNDSLYVMSYQRLTVFDKDNKFVRLSMRPVVSALPFSGTRLVGNNWFISVGVGSGGDQNNRIQVSSLAGELHHSFGEVTDRSIRVDFPPQGYPQVGYSNGNSIWVVSEVGTDSPYVLEQWDIDGRRLAIIERSAAWWNSSLRSKGISVQVGRLHVDPYNRIWVILLLRNPRHPNRVQMRYEVISPTSSQAIVSGLFDEIKVDTDYDSYPPLYDFIPGTVRSFRPWIDSESGIPMLQIFDLYLEKIR